MSHLNAHMKNIKILVAVDETSYAYADKNMIEFVVRNLISNAIKFSLVIMMFMLLPLKKIILLPLK